MATREEIAAVYAGAVIQGIVLVTFPAVSAIFTSADHYGLSNTEYGGMFVPQAITAILVVAARRGPDAPDRRQARAAARAGGGFVLDGAAFPEPVRDGVHRPRLLGRCWRRRLAWASDLALPCRRSIRSRRRFSRTKVDQSILTLNALLGVGTALGADLRDDFRGARLLVGAAAVDERC